MPTAFRIPVFAVMTALLLSMLAIEVRAEDAAVAPKIEASAQRTDGKPGRLMLIEEDDYLASPDDRHYTQGFRATYLFGSDAEDDHRPCDWVEPGLPFFESGSCKRKYEWTVVGQNLYTPQNLNVSSQTAKDRPYGAWLYTGLSLLQEHQNETHNTLENFEIQAGVAGPMALGGDTQNWFHHLIGADLSQGWNNQIHNEPGIVLAHERKWRFEAPISGNFAIDAIPEIGATIGNIFDYGEIGGMVRIGQNLRADYGPNRIRPSLSGTGWFDPDQLDGNLGWYFFAGTQGRVIGRNLFLDGNTFRQSASVDKKPLVADFMGGFSLLWSDRVRADFSVTQRTKEFYGQQGEPDRFGGVNIAFRL